jgi:DME family drug/metabolite transporter
MSKPSGTAVQAKAATTGIAFVMAAAALWATVGVAVQVTPEAASLPDTLLASARTGIAGPTLLAIGYIALGVRSHDLRKLSLRTLFVFALASAVFQVCLFRSFDELGVTIAVFLTVCLPPVLGSAWTAFRGAGCLSGKTGLALGTALVGVALVSSAGLEPDRDGLSAAGLVNGLLASVAFVVMSFSAAEMSRRSPAALVAGAGLSMSSVLLGLVALLFGAGLGQVDSAGPISASSLALILYLGLLPTALAYLLYCAGMARCRTPTVGLVASMVEPFLAALLAMVLIDEEVTLATAAGCGLLTIAMLLLWRGERA